MVNVLQEIAWIYQNNSGIFYIILVSLYIDLGYFFGYVNSKTMNFDWFFFIDITYTSSYYGRELYIDIGLW